MSAPRDATPPGSIDDGAWLAAFEADAAWAASGTLAIFALIALVGQRAPDDRFWDRGAIGPRLLKPRFAVPRAVRPALAAAVWVMFGGATHLVHADGGWSRESAALSLALAACGADAAATWAHQHFLLLRLGLAARFVAASLAAATVPVFAEAADVYAALLAVPAALWTLYLVCEAVLVLMLNRRRVASELDALVVEAASSPLDPLAAPRPRAED